MSSSMPLVCPGTITHHGGPTGKWGPSRNRGRSWAIPRYVYMLAVHWKLVPCMKWVWMFLAFFCSNHNYDYLGRESFERWSYQAMLRLICNVLYSIAGFSPLFSHFLHYMACLTWTYNFHFSICYNLTLLHDVDTMASCLLNWSMNYSIG